MSRSSRLCAATMVVLTIGLTLPQSVAASSPPRVGDLNGDGVVNILDVQLEVNAALGVETRQSILSHADLNGDGAFNVVDVQRVVNILLNNIVLFVPPPGITSSLGAGMQSVGGTGLPGATVKLLVNGIPRGTPTVVDASGLWTVSSLIPPFAKNDGVEANQAVNGLTGPPSATIVVGPAPCGSPGTATTGADGKVPLCSGGFSIPLQVIDEDSGFPVGALTVSLAIDPSVPGRGILLIADPSAQYPFQALVVESPQQGGLPPQALSPNGALVIPVRSASGALAVKAVRLPVVTTLLGPVAPPAPSPMEIQRLMVMGTTQLANAGNVFLPPSLQDFTITTGPPVPVDEYRAKVLADAAESTVGFVVHWLVHEGAALLPVSAAAAVEEAAPLLILAVAELEVSVLNLTTSTIYKDLGYTTVVTKTIDMGFLKIDIPLPFPGPDQPLPFSNFVTVPAPVTAPANSSLELFRKSMIDSGVIDVGTGGTATISIPADSYTLQSHLQGFMPLTEDVTIPSGGGPINVALTASNTVSIQITSAVCTVVGPGVLDQAVATGFVSGPVGTQISVFQDGPGAGCSAWTQFCQRQPGDPPTTEWISIGREDAGQITRFFPVLAPDGTFVQKTVTFTCPPIP